MLIEQYKEEKTIPFLQAVKNYEYSGSVVRLKAFDTLIITDGTLKSAMRIESDIEEEYDEVCMHDLKFKNASYVVNILLVNKCTNNLNDKPFEYSTSNIYSIYMEDVNDTKKLEQIKKELKKLKNDKLNTLLNYDCNNVPSLNNGIYKKELARKNK